MQMPSRRTHRQNRENFSEVFKVLVYPPAHEGYLAREAPGQLPVSHGANQAPSLVLAGGPS